MRNLHVTIWQVNTHAMQYLDLNNRLAFLYKAVDEAYTHLRHLPANNRKLRGIFVAPEYYFAKQAAGGHHQLSEERYLSDEEQHDVTASLTCLSRLYPDLLIIPGTMAWKKPLSDAIDINHVEEGDDEESTQYLIKTLGDIASGNSNISVDVEPQYLLQQCHSIKSTAARACHSVFAYLNGEQVYECHKQDDFEDSNNTLVSDLAGSPVFEVDGLRFGVEIFLDHAYGVLKKPVDIHIILSSCVKRQGGQGKYVIYVSNRAQETGTWKSDGGNYQKLHHHAANQNMDCDTLTV